MILCEQAVVSVLWGKTLRVLIADGHPLFPGVLADVLEDLKPSTDIHRVADFPAMLAGLGQSQYGMILADLSLPGLSCLADIVTLVNSAGPSRVVAVANGHGRDVHRRLRACGIAGLVEKGGPRDEIVRTIAMAMRGGLAFPDTLAVPTTTAQLPIQQELTNRQLLVLALLIKGKSNKQIAKELSLSPNTVKAHVSEVLRKLDMPSRSAVIALAHQPLQLLQAAD